MQRPFGPSGDFAGAPGLEEGPMLVEVACNLNVENMEAFL